MICMEEIFSPQLIVCHSVELTSKKKVLEKISRLASAYITPLKYHHVLDALQQRERIGSTAMGHGIAIPHARIADLSAPYCVVITLSKKVSFSTDDQMVDIIFGLIVPEDYNEDHLRILSCLSANLQHERCRQALREAQTMGDLYHCLIEFSDDESETS